MERRSLGTKGLEISVVGYGAWEAGGDVWGPVESEATVVSAIRAGIDAGMDWIDTAEGYGRGRSEELVGRAVRGLRDRVKLFTKVAPKPPGTGFRPSEVRAALHGSLSRLGTDHVELFQLHWPDRSIPISDTWGAMVQLRDEGLTRAIGVSNVNRWYVDQCLAAGPVDSVQNEFSLLYREDRRTILPWLAERGIGYLAYGPLAFGLLTGAIDQDTAFGPEDWRGGRGGFDYYRRFFAPGKLERNLARVGRLRPIAERLGVSVAALALRWVVEQPGVTAAIAGSRNPEHVRANAQAGSIHLSPEDLVEIESAAA